MSKIIFLERYGLTCVIELKNGQFGHVISSQRDKIIRRKK